MASIASITPEQVRDALREVIDPEIGIDIVELGLVYGIEVEDKKVSISVTMTTPACPLHTYVLESIETTLKKAFPELEQIDVKLVWDPPWRPEMMSDRAKAELGWKPDERRPGVRWRLASRKARSRPANKRKEDAR